jgi:AcrR family transcriptional regulator
VRHYFASSEELLTFSFAAVVDRIVARLDRAYAHVAETPDGSEEHHAAVLTLLGEFLPLDEERALDACAWLAFKNAARIRPFLAAEADRSHRTVAAVVGQLITRLVDEEGGDRQRLVIEAERLLATLDGLTMHALLQPGWMTLEMCQDVLESHVAGLERTAAASH